VTSRHISTISDENTGRSDIILGVVRNIHSLNIDSINIE
jgi:hypothetical protein